MASKLAAPKLSAWIKDDSKDKQVQEQQAEVARLKKQAATSNNQVAAEEEPNEKIVGVKQALRAAEHSLKEVTRATDGELIAIYTQ